jgi:epidermal growth factor receptor substrate 15
MADTAASFGASSTSVLSLLQCNATDISAETTEKPDALKLTPQEKAAFKQLFAQADQGDNGVITGEIAVKFLEKTNVPQDVLGQVRLALLLKDHSIRDTALIQCLRRRQIWQIADNENRGFLTSSAFAVCCRLIGHYQAGRQPDLALAYQRMRCSSDTRRDRG